MKILILHGPNLNLIGSKSAEIGGKITIDKINTGIRRHIRDKDIQIKILQTHKQFHAINFIQRNRNWADGILFIPTSWARTDHTILETIKLIDIKTSVVYFDDGYSFGTNMDKSIMVSSNIKGFTGSPIETCIKGIEHLAK